MLLALCIVVFLTLLVTVDGMVSCGITRRFPISLHRLFLRATNLRKPLKPACTIPCVVCWPLFISVLIIIIFLYHPLCLFSGTGWKALLQNLVEECAMWVLQMCLSAEGMVSEYSIHFSGFLHSNFKLIRFVISFNITTFILPEYESQPYS